MLDRVIDIPDHQGVLTWKAEPVHCSGFRASTVNTSRVPLAVLAMLKKVDSLLIAKSIAINYLRIRGDCALPVSVTDSSL